MALERVSVGYFPNPIIFPKKTNLSPYIKCFKICSFMELKESKCE
jgi:hypothetical protein